MLGKQDMTLLTIMLTNTSNTSTQFFMLFMVNARTVLALL